MLGTPSAPKAALTKVLLVSALYMLSKVQMRWIKSYFPLSHGVARVDDRRILSGIIFVVRNGSDAMRLQPMAPIKRSTAS